MNGSNTNVNTNSHRQTAPIQLPPTSNSMQFNLSSKMENNNFKPLDMQQQQQQQPSESPDKNLHLGTTSNKTNLFKKQRMNSDAAESALRAVQAFKMKTELNFPKQPQTKPAESDRFNPNFNKGNSMDMQEWMPRKSSTPSPTGMVNKRQKYPQAPGSMSMGMQNNSNSTMSQSYTSPSNESMTISPAPPHANASSSQPQDPPQPPPLQQQQQQQQQQQKMLSQQQQQHDQSLLNLIQNNNILKNNRQAQSNTPYNDLMKNRLQEQEHRDEDDQLKEELGPSCSDASSNQSLMRQMLVKDQQNYGQQQLTNMFGDDTNNFDHKSSGKGVKLEDNDALSEENSYEEV
mmetsp:Transcript_20180/g.24873  ORF Transcript_20180/g.24873 Transcript_20180/m.24873 type:complete len:346 (+) Transcript_20180:104-1141(+)